MLRRKKSNTRVATIEKVYNVDFGVRGDMKLQTLLKRERAFSLTELVRRPRKKR